jgi:hypothetical protein
MDPESEFVPSQPVASEKSLLPAVHGVSRNSVTSLRSLGKGFETGTLDRYERRARSQRKCAIRDYDAARAYWPPANDPPKTKKQLDYVLSSFWPNEPNGTPAIHEKEARLRGRACTRRPQKTLFRPARCDYLRRAVKQRVNSRSFEIFE